MRLFKPYEQQVVRALVGKALAPELLEKVFEAGELVSLEHTGVGYFLTIGHSDLPIERMVFCKPMMVGYANEIGVGFVVFVEEGELTLECYTWGDDPIPEEIRDWDVHVRPAVGGSEQGIQTEREGEAAKPRCSKPDQLPSITDWIRIAFVSQLGFWAAILVAFVVYGIVEGWCPESKQVSGMCMAPWFQKFEHYLEFGAVGLAAAFVVLFSTLTANSGQKILVAKVAYFVGGLAAFSMAFMDEEKLIKHLVVALVAGACMVWILSKRVARKESGKRK